MRAARAYEKKPELLVKTTDLKDSVSSKGRERNLTWVLKVSLRCYSNLSSRVKVDFVKILFLFFLS